MIRTLSRLFVPVIVLAVALPCFGQGAMVDLIVEMRQPAAVASASSGAAMETNAMQARTAALPSRIEELRRDLGRLNAHVQTDVATDEAREEARITNTYARVLFGAAVRVPREMVPSIAALPYVAAVHFARTFEPLGSENIQQISADKVWSTHHTRGKGVVVAVIDTGIDYKLAALGGGFGPGFKVAGGYDFDEFDDDPIDQYGHGTYVASIIAADAKGLTGIAPDATLLAYKAIGPWGGSEGAVLAAIERTVDPNEDGSPSDHADVAIMTIVSVATENDPLVKAVENATRAGVLFCAVSGEDGQYGNISSPGNAPSAITVGAVDSTDTVTSFSTRGPSWDFRTKPEVVAPGADLATVAWFPSSGTSLAAAHVAGVAALVKAVHPHWTPAEIKSAIVTGATVLQADIMAAGAGRVDALQATNAAILSSMSTIDFGQVPWDADLWQQRRRLTLHNDSANPQTLTARVDGLRDGVAVTVTPSVITLAAGQSKDLIVDLTIHKSAVPPVGSFSFGGQVVWSGGATPFHIPWSCVEGAFLTIDAGNYYGRLTAELHGDRRKSATREFRHRARKFWGYGTVDVVMAETGYTHPRVVIAESVEIRGTAPRVTVDFNDAKYTIDTGKTPAPDGRLLAFGRTCRDEVVLGFPDGTYTAYYQQANLQYPDAPRYVRFSRMSPRVKIYTATTCSQPYPYAHYYAAHEPLDGLETNRETVSHSAWMHQRLRFIGSGAVTGPTYGWSRLHIGGAPPGQIYAGGIAGYTYPSVTGDLDYFFTTSAGPEVQLASLFSRYAPCQYGPCAETEYLQIYADDDGPRVDSYLTQPPSPMAYRPRPGELISAGDGFAYPAPDFRWLPASVGAELTWRGAFGERLTGNQAQSDVAIYDAAGTLLAKDKRSAFRSIASPPGRYRVEATLPGITVAGIRAEVRFTGHADTSKDDRLLPKYTAMRIEDEDHVQTSIVRRGTHAVLLFAIADEKGNARNEQIQRIPPLEEATLVEYRAHNGGEWHPLPATVVTRQYLQPANGIGTMFRVDLAAATSAITGSVDLRFHIEDTAGNDANFTLAPAFTVFDAPARHRAVSH
ncbi:MAG: S8 family serine peptidase [Acidobacteriota bacterium]|nr:S8 family serine peptidase [Acidobacteriota bacterium]